eukprot:13157-Prymnesium_polylepis.2
MRQLAPLWRRGPLQPPAAPRPSARLGPSTRGPHADAARPRGRRACRAWSQGWRARREMLGAPCS